LRAVRPARNPGGVHKNIGFAGPSAPHPCDAANQIGPHDPLPSRVGERCFGGPAGCPNAAQPELQIVSTPLLGLAVADGKGPACPEPAPQACGVSLGYEIGENYMQWDQDVARKQRPAR